MATKSKEINRNTNSTSPVSSTLCRIGEMQVYSPKREVAGKNKINLLHTFTEINTLQSNTPTFNHTHIQKGNIPFSKISPTYPVQAKLKINKPGDKYEQEADRVAEQIVKIREPQLQKKEHSNYKNSKNLNGKSVAEKATPIIQKKKEEEGKNKQLNETPAGNHKTLNNIHSNTSLLKSTGRPIPTQEREYFEKRFGYDFKHVHVHTDSFANKSARAINARAFTINQNIVFANGEYLPHTGEGKRLMAHELAHVVQQDQNPTQSDHILQCKGVTWGGFFSDLGRAIATTFVDEPDFDDSELYEYLTTLDKTNDIEDDFNSDNKARVVVRKWITGKSPFVLSQRLIKLLIKEMQSGFTGNDDEKYILELLERCENHDLNYIFSTGAINVKSLNDDFHGKEWEQLQDFYERRFVGGLAALLKGKVEARGWAVPLSKPLGIPVKEKDPLAPRQGDKIVETPCSVKNPGNCFTYEQWIQQFSTLPTFTARTGHNVIGTDEDKAPLDTATDPKAKPEKRRPSELHSSKPYKPADKFIDGPTEKWVQENLPRELLKTAYQLPSDCADLAVILRHVWLVGHGRTEVYNGWLCGARLTERSRSKEMLDIITGKKQVGSWNVEKILRPYTGTNGKAIRDFESLSKLLHVGDVLVWEHQDKKHARTGGHTQTILKINRKQGVITNIKVLQGNQPISEKQAEKYRKKAIDDAKKKARKKATEKGESESKISKAVRKAGKLASSATPSVYELRKRAGKRIEVSTIKNDKFLDIEIGNKKNKKKIWSFPTQKGGRDILLAAGPPAISTQPKVRSKRKEEDKVRGLKDWLPELQNAKNQPNLQSIFEAALIECRSLIEGGILTISDNQTAENQGHSFGVKAGEQLWSIAKESAKKAGKRKERSSKQSIRYKDLLAEDLAEESHYRPMRQMSGMLKQFGVESYSKDTRRLFKYIIPVFIKAARGITDISFKPKDVKKETEVVNVLATGFDPFMVKRHRGKPTSTYQVIPEPGIWNPSGAAVLQLDGKAIKGTKKNVAAVEGVVLPVDYNQFRSGIVESVVGPNLHRLDAVVTVSMDPAIKTSDEPVIERYAVGVHGVNNGRLEPIPAAPGGGSDPGPTIIESKSDLDDISKESKFPQPSRTIRNKGVNKSIRSDITFRFFNQTEADSALKALGLPPQKEQEVTISAPKAIKTITGSMQRGVQGTGITFQAGKKVYHVKVLSGPGGSFLSNEVSYRVLRMMAKNPKGRLSTSFHVHTQLGEKIPQEVTEKKERRKRYDMVWKGRKLVNRLVSRLKMTIKSVADHIVSKRKTP